MFTGIEIFSQKLVGYLPRNYIKLSIKCCGIINFKYLPK